MEPLFCHRVGFALSPREPLKIPSSPTSLRSLNPEFPHLFLVVPPTKEDNLVLIALARMLSSSYAQTFSWINLYFAFRKDHPTFYSTVVGRGKVEKLYKLDLSGSLRTLSRPILLEKLEPLVKDRPVLDLVSSFLSVPILDQSGEDLSYIWGAVSRL